MLRHSVAAVRRSVIQSLDALDERILALMAAALPDAGRGASAGRPDRATALDVVRRRK